MPFVTYDIERPADVAERHHRRFLNAAHRQSMTTHRDKRMGEHFKANTKTSPGGGYGYASRSEKYLKRKQKRFGHTRPMDLTGETKRITRRSTIRATFKGATLTIRPNFAGRRVAAMEERGLPTPTARRRTLRPQRDSEAVRRHAQRIAELEALTDQERSEIRDEMREVYFQQLQQFRAGRQRVRIVG